MLRGDDAVNCHREYTVPAPLYARPTLGSGVSGVGRRAPPLTYAAAPCSLRLFAAERER